MQNKTLEIATCSDRDLIFAVNWHGVENDLSQILRTALIGACWRKQDGYGKPGHTPPQGWDWSGIRDSTTKAQGEMAKTIRTILAKHRIATITVTYEDHVEF